MYFGLFHSLISTTGIADTIAGRQAMASFYFLTNQFDEVLVYLNSIKVSFSEIMSKAQRHAHFSTDRALEMYIERKISVAN